MAQIVVAMTLLFMTLLAGGLFCYAWLARIENRELAARIEDRGHLIEMLKRDKQVLEDECSELLKQKAVHRPNESIFDKERDTISPARRFVPLSVRRAQAERQSIGPQNHSEQVRENNAKAMEQAG